MGRELPSRESLEMFLLLLTLISTALAMPAHDCPPFPPADCGEGMRSCPGDTDPMGCPMPEICVADGDECPFFCPHVEHPHCGFVMSNCPGPVDANGCETPMNCIMVDWAAGEQCPPPAEAAAESCMPWSPVDCGEGMKSCPVISTTGHARCLTSALLRETSAHTSVHLSSTPTADLSWPTVLDPSTQWAARPL